MRERSQGLRAARYASRFIPRLPEPTLLTRKVLVILTVDSLVITAASCPHPDPPPLRKGGKQALPIAPYHHMRRFDRMRAAPSTSPSSQCLMRLASPMRANLPDESSSTMITGFSAIVACITRHLPASLM